MSKPTGWREGSAASLAHKQRWDCRAQRAGSAVLIEIGRNAATSSLQCVYQVMVATIAHCFELKLLYTSRGNAVIDRAMGVPLDFSAQKPDIHRQEKR